MPVFFVERLRAQLGDFAGEAKVYSSAEATAKLREKVLRRPTSEFPTFDTQEDLLYIDIPLNRLLMVKAELEKMGVSLLQKDFDPEFHRGEYLCPKCSHLSEAPGLCPKHSVPLLEFSKYAEAEEARRDRLFRNLFLLGGAACLAAFLWVWLST